MDKTLPTSDKKYGNLNVTGPYYNRVAGMADAERRSILAQTEILLDKAFEALGLPPLSPAPVEQKGS